MGDQRGDTIGAYSPAYLRRKRPRPARQHPRRDCLPDLDPLRKKTPGLLICRRSTQAVTKWRFPGELRRESLTDTALDSQGLGQFMRRKIRISKFGKKAIAHRSGYRFVPRLESLEQRIVLDDSSAGAGGILARNLTLADGVTILTGNGIAIGQVEPERPGKPGYDSPANYNPDVRPFASFDKINQPQPMILDRCERGGARLVHRPDADQRCRV